MTWMSVEIDGEAAATKVSDTYPYTLMPEMHAEDLDTVKVIHSTAGDFSCKHCGETWNTDTDDVDDVEGEECTDNDEGGTHEVESTPMTWFEEAVVRVDQTQDEVSVALVVNGKRFRIGVHFAENVAGGSLVLSLPGTSGTREADGCTIIAD